MANEKFSQLPTVTNSNLSDIIPAVQGGTSVQETLQQIFTLMLSNTILHNAGDPNGSVAGSVYQLCWDTTNLVMYVCTNTGSTSTAVWKLAGSITAGTSGQLLRSAGSSAPTWTTATFASTYAVSTILYASGTNAVTGLATANSATLITNSSGVPAWTASLTNGQILIGSTGSTPAPATLTAGSGITITNGAASITIASNSTSEVTLTSASMAVNTRYIANNAALVSLLLPATSAVGDFISVVGKGAGGWTITQASGQKIHIGASASTTGAGGSVASSGQFDSVKLVCIVADTVWAAEGAPESAGLVVT